MKDYFEASNRAGIFTHINPDGDAIGSTVAMASFLESKGKEFRLFYPTGIPENLEFIIPERYKEYIHIFNEDSIPALENEIASCDLLVGLDFNLLSRTGGFGEIFRSSTAPKVLIDHHVGPENEQFNLVYSDTEVSSASELLFRILMERAEICGDASKLPADCRQAIMTGITTDTNNFANSVFPGTMTATSKLLESGVNRDYIIQKVLFSYPERRIRAQGRMLEQELKITPQGVGYAVLSRRFLDEFELQDGDTEGFVNIALSIERVRLSILVKEENDPSGKLRVSLRSKKGTSARDCAMKYFNGGGHVLASGGRLTKGVEVKDINEVAAYIERCTAEFLQQADGLQ